MTTEEQQLHEQQNIQPPANQPQQQPQPGPSQSQPPVAVVLPKPLTVHDKISRQIKTEELVPSRNFKGHPKNDISLHYKLQNHANLYKLVFYNPKTKTYRTKNLGIDKQILSVPFYLSTANLESSENSYIRNLEQSFLEERYRNNQLQQRNEGLLRELREYRHGDFPHLRGGGRGKILLFYL